MGWIGGERLGREDPGLLRSVSRVRILLGSTCIASDQRVHPSGRAGRQSGGSLLVSTQTIACSRSPMGSNE